MKLKLRLKDLPEKKLTERLKMLPNQLWRELKDRLKKERTDWKPRLKLKE